MTRPRPARPGRNGLGVAVPPSERRALFNRDFVLLWQGQLVSQLGNQAFLVAMMFWVMEATGSATVMGALLMCASIPAVLLGPLGGTLADRHSRRAIIVASDVLRGLAGLVFVVLLVAPAASTSVRLGGLFAVAVFGGIVNAVFQPAVAAAIPDVVPRERLAAANSLNQLSVQGAAFVGQALGGVLFRVLGAPVLFLVDAVSFLAAGVAAVFVRVPVSPPTARSASLIAGMRVYLDQTVEGLRFVWHHPGMRGFLVGAASLNLFFMPVFVLLPFYVTRVLSREAEWYGFLLAAISAGSLAGVLSASVLKRSRGMAGTLVAALLVAPLAYGVLGRIDRPLVALGVCALVGASVGLINVSVITLFQLASDPEMRGRVMSVVISISGAATPIGMALGGVLGDLTGKNVPLIFGVCGLFAFLGIVRAVLDPAVRAFLGGGRGAGTVRAAT